MEEIAFGDWPGQPVDLSGSNPWLPAYGFQPPHALLEKEDFIGNPDADLFLQGSVGQHYMYLETIQEETSDDLQSDSDLSESRASSPVGWLATDSESGSVIRIDTLALDEIDSESEREIACPAKRRRQENTPNLLGFSDDDSNHSLSRSSSLLQFETLERQCQDISSSSPSILSTFSFDSLENQRKTDVASPDSLERDGDGDDDCEPPESDYYKSFKIDPRRGDSHRQSCDSLLARSGSDSETSSESNDSDTVLEVIRREPSSRCFDGSAQKFPATATTVAAVAVAASMSAENLSEDSGYSDHLCGNFARNRSSSIPNLATAREAKAKAARGGCCAYYNGGFDACDVEYAAFQKIASNFGSSYQDLSVLDRYDASEAEFRGPHVDRFVLKWWRKRTTATETAAKGVAGESAAAAAINIEKAAECGAVRPSKYSAASASEPNLFLQPLASASERAAPDETLAGYFEGSVCVSSVPKDLNLAGDVSKGAGAASWSLEFGPSGSSIAAKNCDLADLDRDNKEEAVEEREAKEEEERGGDGAAGVASGQRPRRRTDGDMASFKREGSYLEAMSNRVDLSDDEHNPCYADDMQRSTLVEFDRQILKTISETSIPSFDGGSTTKMDMIFGSTPITAVRSTPNLATFSKGGGDAEDPDGDDGPRDLPRKSSLVNRSTSTSGVSDEEKILTAAARSFSGSAGGSKGVHFCPVVAEVNWHDNDDLSETTTEKDSSYSLSSTPEPAPPPTPPLARPRVRLPSPVRQARQMSTSEPELQKVQPESPGAVKSGDEFKYIPLRPRTLSQPDVGGLKRRGSKVVKKDGDGSVLGSYVDVDGVQYQHSHLGDVYQLMPPTRASHVSAGSGNNTDNTSTGGAKKQSQAAENREKRTSSLAVMESAPARREPKSPKTGKLGGFLSRIASFRFSSRKSAEDKNRKKKAAAAAAAGGAPDDDWAALAAVSSQRIATKDDYIYIPLKGPTERDPPRDRDRDRDRRQEVEAAEETAEGGGGEGARRRRDADATCKISAKPPLPKAPPRVVGASVKRRATTAAAATAETGTAFAQPSRPEYRTIDSGDSLPRPMEPMGLIETDLDTEVTVITSGAHVKTRSLMNLGAEAPRSSLAAPPHPARPHKSMEFLLDKQNLKVVEPPENELQKGERVMSEHQLRIQRSLQKLTIPDWYKQSPVPREGFLLKKTMGRERWTGTASKTPSLSSLGSSSHSPVLQSPTPQTHPFVRWSTSKLNSTASSPCASTRSSFNTRQPNGSISPSSIRSSFSYRQPYLGWRSQERLSRPRTPAERLASSLLVQGQHGHHHHHHHQQQQQESPEIQTSIKEVTSAIVHYVSGLKPEIADGHAQPRSSSVSPRGSQKLCWLESSFVGTRPVDAPETPVTLAESHAPVDGHSATPPPPSNLRLELQKIHNDMSQANIGHAATKPSPSSTTLEDVLDSLLGLPSSTRAPSPSHQETASANTSPSRLGEESRAAEHFRRRSEGSEPIVRQSTAVPRRVSFHSSPVLRCRYSRCGRAVSAASDEARLFKNCHNCSYTYCSRACRRAHWEKHRRSCLFSRVGTLCRQVLAAAKEQRDTLLQISLIARRGFLSHGPGAVKCFFPCPEAGERFLAAGLPCLGELTYVRWTDLLPTEMGPHMYTELVRMCKGYNAGAKLVLYVTVCVVSEVPTAGAAKWERQLVSRCAKMRLSRDVPVPEREAADNLETLVLTCAPTTEGKLRQHVFSNIQSQLRMRGVSLRRQYPEIYRQLCTYVEGKCRGFVPMTVYPRDYVTGRSFMCIIMLESEPEGVRQVSAAGIPVNTVNLLQNCDL